MTWKGHAVFITVMGQDNSEEMRKTSGAQLCRRLAHMQLAREMKLRSVPQLHFHYDESVVRGAHLSALIERAVAEAASTRPPETPRGVSGGSGQTYPSQRQRHHSCSTSPLATSNAAAEGSWLLNHRRPGTSSLDPLAMASCHCALARPPSSRNTCSIPTRVTKA